MVESWSSCWYRKWTTLSLARWYSVCNCCCSMNTVELICTNWGKLDGCNHCDDHDVLLQYVRDKINMFPFFLGRDEILIIYFIATLAYFAVDRSVYGQILNVPRWVLEVHLTNWLQPPHSYLLFLILNNYSHSIPYPFPLVLYDSNYKWCALWCS